MQANFDVIPVDPGMPVREGKRFTFMNEALVVELRYLGPNIQVVINNTSDYDLYVEIGDKQGRGNIKENTPSKAPIKIITFPQAMRDMKEVDLQLTCSVTPKQAS